MSLATPPLVPAAPRAVASAARIALTVLGAFASLAAASCAAEPKREPPPYMPRQVVEVQRWEALDGGARIGWVALLEIRDPEGPVRYYRVEDHAHRWVGHASEKGRFSRRVPFQEEEQDLGVWSLAQGAARLLDAKGALELRPVAAEADARKATR